MLTVKDLADISAVINQLKVTINSGGNKDSLKQLRTQLTKLEQQFVDGVLRLNTDFSMTNVHQAIAEAKKKMKGEVQPVAKAKVANVADFEQEVTEVPVEVAEEPVAAKPAVEDEATALASLAARLAEEKKKLATKGKRKTVGEKAAEKSE